MKTLSDSPSHRKRLVALCAGYVSPELRAGNSLDSASQRRTKLNPALWPRVPQAGRQQPIVHLQRRGLQANPAQVTEQGRNQRLAVPALF